ncbi:MAG: DUF4097 family beta strand repeat-containing protein [Clostridia bacterium]|nr:DUF4097 family beta strand repeat-containing protein [Clostridia bacterium]
MFYFKKNLGVGLACLLLVPISGCNAINDILNYKSSSKVFVNEKNLEEFNSVKISSPSENISFIPSEYYGLEICSSDYLDPRWSIENRKLEVKINNNSNFGQTNSEKRYINIYYPKDISFENITINETSGDVSIPDTKVKKLSVDVVSGDINSEIRDCDEISAYTTSGDINIKNNSEMYTTLDTKTVSGNIKFDGKTWNSVKARSTSGDVKMLGNLSKKSTIETVSGNVGIHCNEAISNYSYDISTMNGSIAINEEKFSKMARSFNLNNPNSLVVKTLSGDIRIDFKK